MTEMERVREWVKERHDLAFERSDGSGNFAHGYASAMREVNEFLLSLSVDAAR